ncbi:MAG: hypothetical protein IT318_09900 [Anaerolineales bacterium]|nr:hypothetical protein [Anaerolineales bacterium]
MKIYIDRAHCDLCQSYCDRHVARLVRFPEGEDRPCIQAIEDDGSSRLTLVVQDEKETVTLVLDERDQEIVAFEGLSSFLPG